MILLAQSAQILSFLAFFVGVEARFLELVARDGILHAVHDELDPLLHIRDLVWQRSLAQLDARACLIDQIDCLIRQETIRNVAVRVRYRKFNRFFGIGDRMELLVAFLNPVDDLHCIGFVRRRNLNGLEAAFQ